MEISILRAFHQANNVRNAKTRIDWLAIMRGITILLVVMRHVQLIDMSTGANHTECIMMHEPFRWLRMPVFIFSSGGLLYLSRIRKNIGVMDLYKDKFCRICIPFLFFVNIYYFLKLLTNSIIKTPVDLSLQYYLENYYLFQGHASAPLWFLATLMVFMLMYPLFVYLCRSKWLTTGFFVFCVLIYYIDFMDVFHCENNYFFIFTINNYLVFFFSGIFFFKYKLHNYLQDARLIIPLVVVYALATYYDYELLACFAGIATLVSVCQFAARRWNNLFGSFRDYIYQIYLISLPAQAFVELILWKKMFYNEDLFWLFYVLNVIVGLYLPVLFAVLVKKIPVRIVRLCFGLK